MRTIKARALSDQHAGCIASHEGAATPRLLRGFGTSLVFVRLFWDDRTETAVALDADITIHQEAP